VAQLARQVLANGPVDEEEFVETVKAMVRERAIVLEPPSYEIENFLDYMLSFTLSGWLWAASGVTVFSTIVVLASPDVFPLNVAKWLLGAIFALFLPGYALLELLFPKTSKLGSLERFALEVGVSLAVVPLIGLVLNFTPEGVSLVPIVTALAVFTLALLFAAAIRQFWAVRTRLAENR